MSAQHELAAAGQPHRESAAGRDTYEAARRAGWTETLEETEKKHAALE
jgi:hypothetical protein